jgi:hypothetical protein
MLLKAAIEFLAICVVACSYWKNVRPVFSRLKCLEAGAKSCPINLSEFVSKKKMAPHTVVALGAHHTPNVV